MLENIISISNMYLYMYIVKEDVHTSTSDYTGMLGDIVLAAPELFLPLQLAHYHIHSTAHVAQLNAMSNLHHDMQSFAA